MLFATEVDRSFSSAVRLDRKEVEKGGNVVGSVEESGLKGQATDGGGDRASKRCASGGAEAAQMSGRINNESSITT